MERQAKTSDPLNKRLDPADKRDSGHSPSR